ncbi:NDP-hexose 2,3-dehydratase family protein [Actinomadura sp. ATCC 31491]|uniref:NDP-hexose 2,3-dehydratase family protein n=1 Tax=Actinomadura luzonensis TaxID=2805427 RepID=A0ABT0G917_9ACTN|nr:NDP-hexose 2,3-dehydratase family protein [Actinomadura luzonensis]MCK2221081.1 NDP-hexose 2,3-dehydratase family protein [Actinomadura luzonensis]
MSGRAGLLDPAALGEDLARSARARSVLGAAGAAQWLRERAAANAFHVERIPFSKLEGWSFDSVTGNLGHRSGRFFTVEGVSVTTDHGPVRQWSQPILLQPEIGVLGVLMRRFDGVLHCLVQAKSEPGDPVAVQLSPTVQATRSNFTKVHGGSGIPYLEFFLGSEGGTRTVVDVLQSEQGAWFYRKQNRNMVTLTDRDVPVEPGFRWMSLGEIQRLMTVDHLVNMDLRSVLACLPYTAGESPPEGGFARALDASMRPDAPAARSLPEVLSWLTDRRARIDIVTRTIPLAQVRGWTRTDEVIQRDDGRHFRIIAASVSATNREVRRWSQPLLQPTGRGLVALFVRRRRGVLHLLLQARAEAGTTAVAELAPTVQCDEHSYSALGTAPAFLREVRELTPGQIRYDTLQSEEGGRFSDATNRYVIAEMPPGWQEEPPAGFCWVTVHQAAALLRHGHYLNVQARTLIGGLYALWAGGFSPVAVAS